MVGHLTKTYLVNSRVTSFFKLNLLQYSSLFQRYSSAELVTSRCLFKYTKCKEHFRTINVSHQ